MNTDQAQSIALKALIFLVSDQDRAGTFMAATGIAPDDLSKGAADGDFLAGIIDYILGDEALVVAFAEGENLKPEKIAAVRRALPGGQIDF